MTKVISFVMWLPRLISFVNELRAAWEEYKQTDTYKRLKAEAEKTRDSQNFWDFN